MSKSKALVVTAEVLPAPATKPANDLNACAANILSLHQMAKNCANQAVMYAARCGAELNHAKEICKHGQFMKWMKKNVPEISDKTAERYMKLAEGISKRVLKFDTVSNLLQLPDPRDLKATAHSKVAQAVQKFVDGKTVTQLYLEFGIVKPKRTKVTKDNEKLAAQPEQETDEERRERLSREAFQNFKAAAVEFVPVTGSLASEDFDECIQILTTMLQSLTGKKVSLK